MEAEDVERWRVRLEARLRELREEGDVSIDPNRPDVVDKVDEDAQPLNEMNQVIASRRNRQRALEVERIQAALARLRRDPEEFGECQDCGELIPEGRLEVMPWALYCVACQSERSGPRGKRRRHAGDFLD